MDTFEYMQLMKKQKEEGLNEDDILKLNPSIRNDKAFISNDLLKAMFHQKGSYIAIQLLIFIASQDGANTEKEGQYYHIKFDLKEFMKIHKSNQSTLYKHLLNIQKTVVTFYNSKNKELWEKISLIARQEKITRNIIQIDMHEKIYSKIKEKANFSLLEATNFQNNFSFNTFRVLLLIGMINHQDYKVKKYNLEELNFLFDTNYKNFYEFNRSVFRKAKKELDDNSNLTFEIEKVEDLSDLIRGRPKITHLKIIPIVTGKEWANDTKFKSFRKKMIEQYEGQDIIYASSIERTLMIKGGLLTIKESGKILTTEKAVKFWKYIYTNQDKLITPQLDFDKDYNEEL